MMYAASDHQMLQFPPRPLVMERRWKSNVELAPNCPRCASPNTKFCYYNNYSFSQPRYFCKACRRYWTKGGSLRNVPVGGGCRKRRRTKPFCPSQDDGLTAVTSAVVGGSSCPTPGVVSSYNTSALIAPLSSGCDVNGGSDGEPDIDMAAVFAKFLNQNSSGEDGNGNSNGSPALLELAGNSNLETHLEETMVQCQTRCVTTQEPDGFLFGIPPAVVVRGGGNQDQQEEQIQGFVGHDPTSFGLQSIHDEISQDLLWSDDATTLPNFEWQLAAAQLPEFGSFPSDDQSKLSANVIGDNWSLFDLSAYEIFTRP